jgi:hypothetical protein
VWRLSGLLFAAALLLAAQSDDDRKQELTGAFRYEVGLGKTSYSIPSAPGWGIDYGYRVRPWLKVEAGFEHVPRPVGASVCCQYMDNLRDQLYLVPFGLRGEWESQPARVRLSAGGGGAYFNHVVPSYQVDADGWGWQVAATARWAVTDSRRFWVGATARYYYFRASPFSVNRLLTVGPEFTWSF